MVWIDLNVDCLIYHGLCGKFLIDYKDDTERFMVVCKYLIKKIQDTNMTRGIIFRRKTLTRSQSDNVRTEKITPVIVTVEFK